LGIPHPVVEYYCPVKKLEDSLFLIICLLFASPGWSLKPCFVVAYGDTAVILPEVFSPSNGMFFCVGFTSIL
jgi:hypothetical protein